MYSIAMHEYSLGLTVIELGAANNLIEENNQHVEATAACIVKALQQHSCPICCFLIS